MVHIEDFVVTEIVDAKSAAEVKGIDGKAHGIHIIHHFDHGIGSDFKRFAGVNLRTDVAMQAIEDKMAALFD